MTLNIRIRGAELTRDTELLGSMSPYILVRNMQGGEIKRTTIAKGKNPVFDDVFMVPAGTPALEFVALDKEGGVKAVDDVIGGGIWNCAEATSRGFTGQPFQTFVQITYEKKPAGRIILEVSLGGSAFGAVGGGMMGSTLMGGAMGGGFTSGIVQPNVGGFGGRTTTTTTEVIQGGMMGAPRMMGSTLPAPGLPFPAGGINTSSNFLPPAGGFVSGMGGGFPRPPSPPLLNMGMTNTRPISPSFIQTGPGFVPPPPQGGFIGGPVMNRPPSMMGPPMGAIGGQQVVETTTTTVSNGPALPPPMPMMTSNIGSSGHIGSMIAPPVMTSGLRRSFVNQPQVVTTTTEVIAPPTMSSNLRRSFAASPLPPLPPQQVTSVTTSGIAGGFGSNIGGFAPLPPAVPINSQMIGSGFHQNTYGSNIVVNPGVTTSSYIGQPATTTVTEVTEVYNNPGVTTLTSNIGGGGVMNSGFGAGGVMNSGFGAGGMLNSMAGVAALGATAMGATGAANVAAMNTNQQLASSLGAAGAAGMAGVAGIASVGGGQMMPGPTGMGVDMAGRLVDMGRIRLEKVEHYPSYNLFSMLDDHPPMATFRVMPHKLRNY